MDFEKLIERLWQHNKDWGDGRTQNFFQVCLDCKSAAEALAALQIELKAMRGAANSYKAENARLESELEKVKAERDDAISFIEYLDHNYSGYLEDFEKWRSQKEE